MHVQEDRTEESQSALVDKFAVRTVVQEQPSESYCMWDSVLCVLVQWMTSGSSCKHHHALLGVRHTSGSSQTCGTNSDGSELLRLLHTLTTVVRLNLDWQSALTAAHGHAFKTLAESVIEHPVPYQKLCRCLAHSPLDLSPASAHGSGKNLGPIHLTALLPQAIRIRVAAKRSTYITFARLLEASVTLSLHYNGFSFGQSASYLTMFVVAGGKRHELSLPVDKGQCTCVMTQACLILDFEEVTPQENLVNLSLMLFRPSFGCLALR